MIDSKLPNIIKAFKLTISSLELELVNHNFCSPENTNMGVFTQALFGYTDKDLANELYRECVYLGINCNSWWRKWTTKYWPMGINPRNSMTFERLYNYGLNREDIVEIEYLNNSKINDIFEKEYPFKKTTTKNIYETKTREVSKTIYKTLEWSEEHYRKDWWGKLWGLKETIMRTQEIEDDIEIITEEYKEIVGSKEILETKNYMDKEHVIAYFKIWVDELEKSINSNK